MLSPFGSKTARNLPSNAKFIFGPSTWLRSLIKPEPGTALAYIDYTQQEFAIAAMLSGDMAMQEAYLSGDPYLKFGQQAGVIPPDGTKETHPEKRKLFKACALGVQYGMGGYSLAGRIGGSVAAANMLIGAHKRTYKKYWSWVDAVVNHALLYGNLTSTLGWQIHVGEDPNIRSLGNWPIQTNGSEILRVAVILLVEARIKVCAPVHDAILIESALDQVEQDVEMAQNLMQKASKIVLGGFKIRTEAEIVRFPNRYKDERGEQMWNRVIGILERVEKN
jgi:DNA polymerase I-like protein with 3'-5' exonuclease and polymerase domains